ERVSYRLKTLKDADRAWMSLSRSEGALKPPRSGPGGLQRDSHTISLVFLMSARGVYSTYLIIENIDNPLDTKTVRIWMEVVARQNVRRTVTDALVSGILPSKTIPGATLSDPTIDYAFDVRINGTDITSASLEMDNLYYETEYSARSFIIFNNESVP